MPASLNKLKELITKENLIIGEEAIKLSGMQDSLIEIISMQNLYFGSITSFKVSNFKDIPPFNSPGVPKPSNIHSKTSNLVGGYIPVDPIFTRLDINRNPLGHHYKDNLELQESVQVKWTLWELLKRCDSTGDLYMDWQHEISPIIRFRFKENQGPKDFDGCFELNLGEEKKGDDINITDLRIITRSSDDPEKYLHLIPSPVREAFLNNKDIICIPYKIFYNKEKNSPMQPLKVFSVDGKPIIGDWDKDVESLPLKAGILNLESANKEYNTFFFDMETDHFTEQVKLIKATKNLFLNFLYKDFIFNDDFNNNFFLGLNKRSKNLSKDIDQLFYKIAIKTSLLERAGIITPYEFFANILTNHAHNCNNYKKGLADYFNDPCQHGVEARSPFYLDKNISSNSDGPRFHIVVAEDEQFNYSVYFIYTINELQRIKLYLVDGILESNFIHISHWLDMSKWSPIIEKQIELKQNNLISDKTLDKYFLYLSTKNIVNLPGELPLDNNFLSAKQRFNNIVQAEVSDEKILFNLRRRRSSLVDQICNKNHDNFFMIHRKFSTTFLTSSEELSSKIYNDNGTIKSGVIETISQKTEVIEPNFEEESNIEVIEIAGSSIKLSAKTYKVT